MTVMEKTKRVMTGRPMSGDTSAWRLSKREEREVEAQFGEAHRRYAEQAPALIPRFYRLAKGPA